MRHLLRRFCVSSKHGPVWKNIYLRVMNTLNIFQYLDYYHIPVACVLLAYFSAKECFIFLQDFQKFEDSVEDNLLKEFLRLQ